jgi:hypothetical protein
MISPTVIIAATCLLGLCVVAMALLQAWHGWLELKRRELDQTTDEIERQPSVGAARIEMADLKERIKKLEAIASGVEL